MIWTRRQAKLAFIGTSHAAQHLSAAAREKGFELVAPAEADVVFVSEDTPIREDGSRDESTIEALLASDLVLAARRTGADIVVTSQVEPGFTRHMTERHAHYGFYAQTELLRMKDAGERARHPDVMIVGCRRQPADSEPYWEYLHAFDCPVLFMTWEEAEFAKIAINMALASQVDYANSMKAACEKIGADWNIVRQAMQLDSRIGPHAYLEPGRWQDSLHLLRDSVTLAKILKNE